MLSGRVLLPRMGTTARSRRSLGLSPHPILGAIKRACDVPIETMRAGKGRPADMMRFIDVRVGFSHARGVPRRTKSEKLHRDRGIIAGIRNDASLWTMVLRGKPYTPPELIALFEAHLRALERVSELTTQRAVAIAEEQELEARIAKMAKAVKSRVAAYFGADAPEMEEFGFRPDKKPTMSAETKRRANEKRQATRKERGIMGRKQRKKAKAAKRRSSSSSGG
jgi:hypothetical protein